MDAIEFLKEKKRMCKTICNCDECNLYKEYVDCESRCFTKPEEAVAIVEAWAKEHPAKTRQSEFLKICPNAQINEEHGVICICPIKADITHNCLSKEECPDIGERCWICKRRFWLAEVD